MGFKLETTHELETNINWHQYYARVSGGLDKIKTSVYAVVDDLLTVYPVLLLQVGVEASLNVLDDRLPAMGMRISHVRIEILDLPITFRRYSQNHRNRACPPR